MDTALPAGADPVHQRVRASDPERDAFEAEMQKRGHPESRFQRDDAGEYFHPAIYAAWQAWQAARPKRAAVGAIYNVAADLAQRKPLRALDKLTEATRIGHRQMAHAYEQADEATRLLAVKLSDALRAL